MKAILPITVVAGIIIGVAIRPHIAGPDYLTVNFENNHYTVEQVEESTIMPPVAQAQASEPEITPIEAKIRAAFGEDASDAITVAKCESGLNPSRIGDKALITYNGNDIVGDSIGLFQIRTGGKDFNRARANGMSPDEFRAYLLDEDNNIKYAKEIFDRQGWSPWTCKKDL